MSKYETKQVGTNTPMNNVAFSLVKNDTAGKWELYSVTFNSDNKVPGKVELIQSFLERLDAQERFKIIVAETMFNE